MSCAQRRTRPRAVRSKHVASRLAEPRALRPSKARPDRTTSIPGAPKAIGSRLASCAPLTTRGGRTRARSSQGPYARGSCHARELVTRAATFKRESSGNPGGDRRPSMEGRTGRGPRNPTDSETTRSRVGAEPPRVSRDVSGSAHTRPRSRSSPTRPRSRSSPAARPADVRCHRANCPRCPSTSRIVSAASSSRT